MLCEKRGDLKMEETTMKQAKKTFSRLGWCYIAGTVLMYVLQIGGTYLLNEFKPEWMLSTDIRMIFSVVTTYGCAMPLIALLVKGMEVTKLEPHKMKWWQFLLAFVMCYSMIFVSNILGNVITALIGLLKGGAVQNNLVSVVMSGNLLVNFVAMVIFAPIVEEYVFRKLIVDRTVKYGQSIAILSSGLMFGLFHGNLNQFAYAMVLGCFFAFIYLRTGKLRITIIMHAIVNFMGSTITGGLMKMVRYDELLMLDPNDQETMLAMMTEDIVGWMLMGMYFLLLFAIVITGIVFIFLSLGKMKSIPQETDLPKGQRAKALFVNPGMIAFCVIWVVLIIIQLFM